MKFLASALLTLVVLPVGSSLAQMPTPAPPSQPQPPATSQDTTQQSHADILRDFKSYYIKSDTIYMHRETLLKELQTRWECALWELTPTENAKAADVVITITLPFLTWEWNYQMVYQPTGAELGSGKVSAAVEKTAAPQLAAMIVKRIREVRPLPVSFRDSQDTSQLHANISAEKGKSWRMRYISGPTSGVPKNKPVTLTLNHESMTVRDSKAILFSASVQNLNASDSRTEVRKATKGWEDFWDSQCCGDGGGAAALLIAPVFLVGEGILAPIKTTDHFVSMYWLEDGTGKGAEFRVRGGDAKSLIAELNKITGKTPEDLIEVSQKRLKTMAERFEESPFIETDRQVKVGWRDLAAGNYRVVVVPRERNLGEVYFFKANFQGGSFTSGDVSALALVEFERRKVAPGSNRTPTISYGEQNGIVTFSQIETNEFILRFTPIPLGFVN